VILCMVVSIILGMGLPTSACYIIAASIAMPILREFKVPGLQAHMFIFYYSYLGFIVPFFFIYSPAMLLVADSNMLILWSFVTGIVGTLLLAIAVEGYLYIPINWILRGAFFVSALTLIYPGLETDLIGFVLGALGLWYVLYLKKKTPAGAIQS